ncbi:MAG: hypothetical protein D6762_01935 [Candidatus Neomarinimicrobiota bacterium]|nr:MAG: hypothetical protein D6762_01935 [Candidatus Neomarinimicrobiota bacterium]
MNDAPTSRLVHLIRRPMEIVFLRYVVLVVVAAPIVMWILWLFQPCRPLHCVIVDKSSLDETGHEHTSLTWVLDHDKYVSSQGYFFRPGEDYYGFHGHADNTFTINDLDGLSDSGRAELARTADLAYFAESYGVYERDWYHVSRSPPRLIYGGLSDGDLDFMRRMDEAGKLVIAEFSFLSPPTTRKRREAVEALYHLHSTGWTGRFFESLDTLKSGELPYWVTLLYQRQHPGEWPFQGAGIVLVNPRGEIVILDSQRHLKTPVPVILTTEDYQETFKLPAWIPYPFWFDITFPADTSSQAISMFHLPVNAAGDSLLQAHHIPENFPAVILHGDHPLRFVYLCGDFSDNPVPPSAAFFRGIHWFQTFFHNPRVLSDRRGFFWEFYLPLISHLVRGALDQASGSS